MLDKNIFSERLKYLRISKNLNQESLASAIGVGKSAISMIENAQRAVSTDTLIALADYFNVPIDYLVGRIDSPFIFDKDGKLIMIIEAISPPKPKNSDNI